jgi:hypothetical protein
MKYSMLLKTVPRLLFTLLFSLIIMSSFAQYENTSGQKKEGDVKKRPAPQKPKRWFAGGFFGAGFGSDRAYVEVSPLVGYKVTPSLWAGTRITYIYSSYEFGGQRESYHDIGLSLFAQYNIYKGILAYVEYESIGLDFGEGNREWISNLFIGGGYLQSIGGRGFASFLILFNVLDNPYYVQQNPYFRIGFGVGF